MNVSKTRLSKIAVNFVLFCVLLAASSSVTADPPIELPPITVYADFQGGSEVLCYGLGCSSILGSTISQALYEEINDSIGQGDIVVHLPVQDILDNPNNSETGVTCDSDLEIRTNHARQDVGPYLPNLDIMDAVKINYEQGDSETGVIQCRYCGVPVVLIPSTCG